MIELQASTAHIIITNAAVYEISGIEEFFCEVI